MKVLTKRKYQELLEICELNVDKFVKDVLCAEKSTDFILLDEVVDYTPNKVFKLIEIAQFKIPLGSSQYVKEEADRYNARLLHKLLDGISPFLGNDPLLWTSIVLLNDSFREYTVERWGLNKDVESVEDRSSKAVIRRIFYEGTGTNTKRNSAARLWWYCELAYSNLSYFKFVDHLLSNNDLAIGLIERNWATNREYVRTILVVTYYNKLDTQTTREMFKKISAALSVKVVALLGYSDFLDVIENLGFSFAKKDEIIYELERFDLEVNVESATKIEILNWDGEYICTSQQSVELIKRGELTSNGFRYKNIEFVPSNLFPGDYCCVGDFGDQLIIDL